MKSLRIRLKPSVEAQAVAGLLSGMGIVVSNLGTSGRTLSAQVAQPTAESVFLFGFDQAGKVVSGPLIPEPLADYVESIHVESRPQQHIGEDAA